MPFNGTGMFVRVRNWVADAAAGIKIRADYHDIEDDGFADGLGHCIAKDGQTTIMANIPMNSKRITSLADPVNPQDAATMAYADTKMPLAGGTMNGSLNVVGGISSTTGYKTRAGVAGPYGSNWFNFNWTGNLQVWVDTTNVGDLATTAYVENRAQAWAHAIADPKVNRAGDTMSGVLTLPYTMSSSNIYYFSTGAGYLQWQGGGTYVFGSGGTAWHTGNLNPVTNGRWVDAGQTQVQNGWNLHVGWAVCGLYWVPPNNGAPPYLGYIQWQYLQLLTPQGYVTVG